MALSERAGVQLNTPEPLEALRYRLLREAERGVQCEVSEAEALEFRRLQYGLSRRDFAEILGIMPSHFSEILSGKRRLPINAVARAVAIGVPVPPLLQGRPSSGSKPKGGQHGDAKP